ncbi:MAG: hypothetical protein ACOCYE_09265, partial [Pseudomonadota bacterium]
PLGADARPRWRLELEEAALLDLAEELDVSPNAVRSGPDVAGAARLGSLVYPSYFVSHPHVFASLLQAALALGQPVRLIMEVGTPDGLVIREFVPEPTGRALAELEAVDPLLGQGLRDLFLELHEHYDPER